MAFIPGVAANERSGVWSQKFEPKTWIPRFRFLQACGFVFYIIMSAVMYIFPPAVSAVDFVTLMLPFTSIVLIEVPIQHIVPIIILFSLFTVTMFFGGFAEILTQRELLDAIPNRNRNSLYSLQPTILLLLAIPQIAILGWIIPVIGFPATLLICAGVSLIGVLIIRYALTLEKPVVKSEAVSTDDLTDEVIPEGQVDTPPSGEILDELEHVVTSSQE